MDSYKSIEAKIWGSVSMLTSGILTSLIYGLLSDTSYSLVIDGQYYEIMSVGGSLWHAIGIVVFTFLGIWVLIFLLIPRLLKVCKRLCYDRIKPVSVKEAIKVLDEANTTIKELYPIFCAEKNYPSQSDFLKLYSRNISKTVLLLHKSFLPKNKRARKKIESYFRQPQFSSIISINQKISVYELASVVDLLKKIVQELNCTAENDALLVKDCAGMNAYLTELEQLNPMQT